MKTGPSHAFSLVEVALALGVAAFALSAIFGLLPIGTNSNRAAIEQTTAASLATSVVSDLRATLLPSISTPGPTSPQFGFNPASSGVQSVFIADDGSVVATAASAHFRATVTCTPPAAIVTSATPRTATLARVLITWPAVVDPTPTTAPTKYNGSFETVIALDRN